MTEFEKTFDNAAAEYDRIRPTYVRELFDDIFRYKQVDSDSHVLEIGIGTGKATLPMLEKRCHLTALEPGNNLAEIACEKYRDYGNFSLCRAPLQDFVCPPESFDLIYSATAFHWIPEEYGYKRVFELLKEGGAFARFACHAGEDKGREELAGEIQLLYRQYMGSQGKPLEYSAEDAAGTARIADKYGFLDTRYRMYHITKDFTADEYMMLLRTYPDHMKLEASNREKLFKGIHRAVNKYGGIITVYYTMDLQLARKENTGKYSGLWLAEPVSLNI